MILPECTEFNEHAIDLENGKQLLYGPIYSLGPVKLEILKTYIEIHLKTWFIRPSMSSAGASILLIKSLTVAFVCM